MEALPRVVFAPGFALRVLVAILAGVALGTASGLTPGLHANSFALGLAALAPGLPVKPELLGAAMVAAGTTHTFLDVVPALALGVPDPAMAAGALPGHRLVLAGRGREALRLSALGSGLAVAVAVPLAVPLTGLMGAVVPVIYRHLSLVLGGVAALLVLTEHDRRAAVGAAIALGASTALGAVTLDLDPSAPLAVGGMLAPLFAGLFGAPVLLESVGAAGVPRQDDPAIERPPRRVIAMALVGALAGAIVGYVPGISAAIAASGALAVFARSGPRTFVVVSSGVNTATAVFALFALVALGGERTGVAVAISAAGAGGALPVLLAGVAVASPIAAAMVPVVGDRYLVAVRDLDPTRLAVLLLAGLLGLAWLFAGPVGVGAFAAATAVGSIPARFGARRSSLMGVLLGPLALGV